MFEEANVVWGEAEGRECPFWTGIRDASKGHE